MPTQHSCKFCGAPIEVSASSCSHCGAAISVENPTPGSSPAVATESVGEPEAVQVHSPSAEKTPASSMAARFVPFIACMPFIVAIVVVLAIFAFYVVLVCAGVIAIGVDKANQPQITIESPEPMEDQ